MGASKYKIQTSIYLQSTTTIPKYFNSFILLVGGYPIIFHHLKALSRLAEVKNVYLMGFYDEKKFLPFIDYAKTLFNYKIAYVQEEIPFNTTGALLYYKDLLLKDKPYTDSLT